MEAIGIAWEVYLLGFVIALGMVFIIKLILFAIQGGGKQKKVQGSRGEVTVAATGADGGGKEMTRTGGTEKGAGA